MEKIIKVHVSIVGFYFGIEVNIPKGSTISDAMQAASEKSRGSDKEFTFSPSPEGFLSNVTVVHKTKAKSRNSKNKRDAGIYSYTDDANYGNPSLVWQYYIFTKNDERREPRGSEVPFQKNKTKLQDGDQVIWRLVGICTGPTTAASTKKMLTS